VIFASDAADYSPQVELHPPTVSRIPLTSAHQISRMPTNPQPPVWRWTEAGVRTGLSMKSSILRHDERACITAL